MGGEKPITVEAIVVEVMSHRVFTASLPNGKIVTAHIPSRKAGDSSPFKPGDQIVLEMTPYDFSSARIRID